MLTLQVNIDSCLLVGSSYTVCAILFLFMSQLQVGMGMFVWYGDVCLVWGCCPVWGCLSVNGLIQMHSTDGQYVLSGL